MESETTSPRDAADLEERVESMAAELAAVINSARGEGRETLRELALTIVREEVRTAGQDVGVRIVADEVRAPKPAPSSAIALGIPLFMMGCVTIFLFPPVGLVMFGLSGLLVIGGIVTSLFSRR